MSWDYLCAPWSPLLEEGEGTGQDGGAKLGIAANRTGWPVGRFLAPGRAGVGRCYADKGRCIFLYVQTVSNLLAFVMNVCLKTVSDVSVPLLFFVFRFNPHFRLSAQHPEYFQTSTRKCSCYVLCDFPSFFSRKKTVQLPKNIYLICLWVLCLFVIWRKMKWECLVLEIKSGVTWNSFPEFGKRQVQVCGREGKFQVLGWIWKKHYVWTEPWNSAFLLFTLPLGSGLNKYIRP